MTTSVTTVATAAAAAGPRPATAGEPRDSAGSAANEFDSQLHVARQQQDARSADDAPGNPDQHQRTATAPGWQPPEADRPADPAATPAAPPSLPPATSVAAPEMAPVAATTAPAEKDGPDEPPAAAVAAAVLALLGPAMAGALPPAAAGRAGAVGGAPGQAGKAAAIGAGIVAMLPSGDAGSTAAAPAGMLPPATGIPALAASVLPAPAATDKDSSGGQGLAMALPAPPAVTAPAIPHQLQLPSPPGSPAFAHDLGQQVVWLGGQDVKQARIRLHPEELGSLDVSVSVTHGRVEVVFSAQHPAAIPAVQQSLPQLGQMLAQHGLSLGHAEVGQRDRGDRRGHAGNAGAAAVDEIADVHGGMPAALGKVGLLDAFA